MRTIVDAPANPSRMCLWVARRAQHVVGTAIAAASWTYDLSKNVCSRFCFHESPPVLLCILDRFANVLLRMFCHEAQLPPFPVSRRCSTYLHCTKLLSNRRSRSRRNRRKARFTQENWHKKGRARSNKRDNPPRKPMASPTIIRRSCEPKKQKRGHSTFHCSFVDGRGGLLVSAMQYGADAIPFALTGWAAIVA